MVKAAAAGPAPGPGVALVTGAARRLGRAIALELARAGLDVAVHHATSAAEAASLVAEIEALGRRATALQADLADEAAAAALVGRAAAALGPVTVLVNNAAIFELDRPSNATAQSWQRHMAINARAPLVLSQGLMAELPDDVEGAIVNLIDARVWCPTPNYTSYTASKFALWGLTQHLALALAPRVRVNGIGPGLALPHPSMPQERFDTLARATPLRRGTSAGEVARAVRFILEQPAMTGQMVALDGGQHLGWLTPGRQGAAS